MIAVNSGGTTLTNSAGVKQLTVSGSVGGTGALVLLNNSNLTAGLLLSGTTINNAGTVTNSGTGGTGSGSVTICRIVSANS